jgi:predicted dehydrogenase
MIDEVRPDILLIATRTEGRARLIEHAAEKGVGGVHFEKPLAHSVMECRHALAAAEVAGVKLSYGAVRRCMDVPRRVKKGIDAEEMGMLRQIVIECGRVELLWSHPHHFDLITFFAGLSDVEAIQARMTFETAAWSERVLDADPIVEALSIQFRGRLSATILPTGAGVVRLICERGEYVIGGNTSWLAVREYGTGIRVSGEREVSVPFTMSGRRRALMELASAVRGEGATSYSAADILRSNQLGLAGAWSAVNQGRMVRLDEVPDDFTVTGRKGDLFA